MILNREDALYAANVFIDYFQNFGRIDDYLRKVKLERMSNYPTSLPGMGPQDDMFSDFTMHPNDMQFECRGIHRDFCKLSRDYHLSCCRGVSARQVYQVGGV